MKPRCPTSAPFMPHVPALLIALAFVGALGLGCGPLDPQDPQHPQATTEDPLPAQGFNDLNWAAGTMVLYEIQARTANACHPDVGAAWQREACRAKISPNPVYRAENGRCDELGGLHQIRLGTLDDLLEDTADYRAGITVRYVHEKVGANTIWLMPVFPNNDRWSIPASCDNLGSPYAVRDYLHARGSLDRWCIERGIDEYSAAPCWGNGALEEVIDAAHRRGLKVMLDLALHHFGHNYLMYDSTDFDPIRARVARGENLDRLWDFSATEDSGLLHPALLDTASALDDLASRNADVRRDLAQLRRRCPRLEGDPLVRAFNMWRVAFDWERDRMPCDPGYLEFGLPGFYLGRNGWDPATSVGDTYRAGWPDVKFLFHQEGNWHRYEFVRMREYLFRILNYWVSRGIDGFRLDHTTDGASGLGPNEWDYLLSKVDYYAWRRGQARPVYLSEEFHDQLGMNQVTDVMTEGYLGDMTGRNGVVKNTSHVERIIDNMGRFGGHTYVMTALETHDELRLLDGTGFNEFTGAGFFGIGATAWSTPMLLMGQEFGEPRRLAFRKSDFLRSRFEGTAEYKGHGDSLRRFYRSMIRSRLASENRALFASNYRHLRSRWTNEPDQRIYAVAKWSHDGNVVFAFHNLWEQEVSQSFYLDDALRNAIRLDRSRAYRLVNVLSGQSTGPCRRGSDLAYDFFVRLGAGERLQWLRLELCP